LPSSIGWVIKDGATVDCPALRCEITATETTA